MKIKTTNLSNLGFVNKGKFNFDCLDMQVRRIFHMLSQST